MADGSSRRRIFMWSGPRNVSTALMYSFAERPDTRIVDEPLYAHYLATTGARHPGREAVLASMETDGNAVMRELVTRPLDRPVLFAKQMAHHLVDIDLRWLERADNLLLIRDPAEMLPSLAEVLGEVTLADTGLERQVALVRHLEAAGREPFCIDARQLLLDPEAVLREACERLGIEFWPGMLHWRPGPRAEDGVWAEHWYAGVHRSTGFRPWRPGTRVLPPELRTLHETCRAHYDLLFERAIRAPGADDAERARPA
jgi:hypothetical protein